MPLKEPSGGSLPNKPASPDRIRLVKATLVVLLLCICVISRTSPSYFDLSLWHSGSDPASYSHLASHCSDIPPISQSEYYDRQIKLAKKLHALNASAYIAEPGANSQFYGNFSKADWNLSERPLLLIISPIISQSKSGSDSASTEIRPQVTILTPKFEATRARMLPVPSAGGAVRYMEWAEEANPYAAALSAIAQSFLPGNTLSTIPSASAVTIFVDNSIRTFIVDGLLDQGLESYSRQVSSSARNSTTLMANVDNNEIRKVNVVSAPLEITQMRERKSKAELQILKCVNEATLLAIREIHQKLYPGIQESQARSMMATALGAAELKAGGCLTLFGENAALPHGSGTNRRLSKSDFALFDCTASLHGYYSDVTRTVALSSQGLSNEQVRIWNLVHAGQRAALAAARNGTRTRNVDEVVRALFKGSGIGYEQYFTHRLGHGIGLEVHETPYLRGGSDDIIRPGHTFSDEPGIYIEGKVGVRLEDCFYINEDGVGVLLTDGVGGLSNAPWLP
ncbi:Creatinase/aminopeptidase [Agrocybe pediades]|nr:Creatinase/aminopeptidase [Agrocybe pediades]